MRQSMLTIIEGEYYVIDEPDDAEGLGPGNEDDDEDDEFVGDDEEDGDEDE